MLLVTFHRLTFSYLQFIPHTLQCLIIWYNEVLMGENKAENKKPKKIETYILPFYLLVLLWRGDRRAGEGKAESDSRQCVRRGRAACGKWEWQQCKVRRPVERREMVHGERDSPASDTAIPVVEMLSNGIFVFQRKE